MKQFHETYASNEKLSPPVREISRTNNIMIMTHSKSDAVLEFYVTPAQKNNYSKRELENQMDSRLFERAMISDIKDESSPVRL